LVQWPILDERGFLNGDDDDDGSDDNDGEKKSNTVHSIWKY
jgi:hypothetical protein